MHFHTVTWETNYNDHDPKDSSKGFGKSNLGKHKIGKFDGLPHITSDFGSGDVLIEKVDTDKGRVD